MVGSRSLERTGRDVGDSDRARRMGSVKLTLRFSLRGGEFEIHRFILWEISCDE